MAVVVLLSRESPLARLGNLPRLRKANLVTAAEPECICTPWGGCDEEGEPGCAYCRALDCEWPCPADLAAMEDDPS